MSEPLRQAFGTLKLQTRPRHFHDLTDALSRWLVRESAADGLLTVLVRHTSASLIIQENTDPEVRRDLADALARLAPVSADYRHALEGNDDMPAHIKSAITATSLGVPVAGGRMALGTWQAVYLAEHRDRPHEREVALHYVGTFAR